MLPDVTSTPPAAAAALIAAIWSRLSRESCRTRSLARIVMASSVVPRSRSFIPDLSSISSLLRVTSSLWAAKDCWLNPACLCATDRSRAVRLSCIAAASRSETISDSIPSICMGRVSAISCTLRAAIWALASSVAAVLLDCRKLPAALMPRPPISRTFWNSRSVKLNMAMTIPG